MLTKLDAVNEMLEAVGEMRVNSLIFEHKDGSINHDGEMALAILNRETKRILSKGWWFNRDDKMQITADRFGTVYIPKNALSIEEADRGKDQYVRRGNRLYNRTTKSFHFSINPLCKIIWEMNFESCPTVFASYAVLKSIRSMVDKVLGDQVLHAYSQQDEERAYLELIYEENEQLDANVFDTPDMADALDRRSGYPPYWLY